jgi:hypothetical protein
MRVDSDDVMMDSPITRDLSLSLVYLMNSGCIDRHIDTIDTDQGI